MYNAKKNTYVTVEFTVLDWVSGELADSKSRERLKFTCAPIVEVAAVKIKNGKICEREDKKRKNMRTLYKFYRIGRRESRKFI